MLQPPEVQHKRGQGGQEGQQVMAARATEEREREKNDYSSPIINRFSFVWVFFTDLRYKMTKKIKLPQRAKRLVCIYSV